MLAVIKPPYMRAVKTDHSFLNYALFFGDVISPKFLFYDGDAEARTRRAGKGDNSASRQFGFLPTTVRRMHQSTKNSFLISFISEQY